MLKALRYSQWIALAVVGAVVIALAFLYRNLMLDSMIESETHASVALTKAFAGTLWPQHAAFVKRAGSLSRPTLAGRPEIEALDRDLRRLSDGLNVVKMKLYRLDGLTVYSSDPRQIGQDASRSAGFRRARDGYAYSGFSYRERFDAWEGELAERHIHQTYVPVHVQDAAPVEAVLEVYTDVTDLVAAMQAGQWRILAWVLGATALVVLALQVALTRYQREVREHERARAAREERIRHQAYHDALTGLPNRTSFDEHLPAGLRRAKRADWPLALLFLDLDHFKRINDGLGHDAGDRVLRIAAERIRRAVREADQLFRISGDEFTVLLEDVRGPEEAAAVAERVLEALGEPMRLSEREVTVSASIGIALYPHDEALGERLLKAADTAMYRAKQLGRNRYAFYAREASPVRYLARARPAPQSTQAIR